MSTAEGTGNVVLGVRHARAPANIPARSDTKAFKTAMAYLRGPGADVVAAVEQRVNHTLGRTRQLRVDVLLAAGIASARGGMLEPRKITGLLLGLGSSTQIEYGIREITPAGPKLVTEAMVRWLFTKIPEAFLPDNVAHTHPVIDGDHLIDLSTGEILAPADSLTPEEVDACACEAPCPAATTAESLGNALLTAGWDHFSIPDSDTWALDSYIIETHYRPRSWGSADKMRFPDEPDTPRASKPVTVGKARSKKPTSGRNVKTSTTTAALDAYEQWVANEPETVPPGSRRRRAAGPTAAGDFTRIDPAFPQIGPDGRLIHTIDTGARNGFRGAGNSRRTEIVNGRDKHAIVASGHFNDGTAFPALLRSYSLTCGGGNKTTAALAAADHAATGGAHIAKLTLDRGYTNVPADQLLAPMRTRGVRLIMDHKQHQHRTNLHSRGILEIDGNYFTDATPVPLRTLAAHTKNTPTKKRQELASRYDQRTAYMFRPNGSTSSGFAGQLSPTRPSGTEQERSSKPQE